MADCKQCGSSFQIADEDLKFYEQVSPVFSGKKYLIPPPKYCPDCRQQRRLAWRNEHHLYNRNCDLCNRNIISVHSENARYPVYCVKCWWSDKWDPLAFGIDLDHSKSFLEQFLELQGQVPQLAIQNDDGIESENSEYCYDISRTKNCYRLIGSWYDQECHYSLNVNHCKYVVDSNTISENSELVYQCLDSQHLYHCAYLQNCEGCNNCFFGYDLRGCSDCIGCYGLRQKKYCIFNKQYSEQEYRNYIDDLNMGSYQQMKKLQIKFDDWILEFPRKFSNQQNCEKSVGNNLFSCKQVLGYSIFNGEYCKYVDRCDGPKNSFDLINSGKPQWCYDCVTPDDSYNILFSVWCWKSKDIMYSDNCHSCEHLFGCISLHRNQYCILNKQYSKEEYEHHLSQIIPSMEKEHIWGGHLPIALSPFAYNESAANEYYPLDCNTVLSKGWKWTESLPYTKGKETIEWNNVPDNIQDIDPTIADETFACIKCKRNYRLIPNEIEFYKKMPAPLPRSCPQCRTLARFHRKTPTRLWLRQCAKCSQDIQTTYSPDRPEIVYCEACYHKEVYG